MVGAILSSALLAHTTQACLCAHCAEAVALVVHTHTHTPRLYLLRLLPSVPARKEPSPRPSALRQRGGRRGCVRLRGCDWVMRGAWGQLGVPMCGAGRWLVVGRL